MPRGLLLLLILAGCCTVGAEGRGPVRVDRQALELDLRFLADDALAGRGLGSKGLETAAAYHEAAFRAMGLEPFDGQSFRQPFDLEASMPDPDAQVAFAAADGGSFSPRLAEEVVVVTQHRDLPVEVGAEVVYAGYFIQARELGWDNLAGADLKGKVVVVEINEPDSRPGGKFDGPDMTWHGRWVRKFELAASAGAAGILIIHNDVGAGYGWKVVRNGWTNEQLYVAGSPTESLMFMGWLSEDAGKKVLALAGQDRAVLRQQAESPDFRPVALPLSVTVRQKTQLRQVRTENVVGLLRSPRPEARDRYVVVSAHYDHMGMVENGEGDRVFNGAVDNCAASAAMLATAKVLAGMKDQLRVNVFFLAASAEEEGLLGTEWFVRHLPVPAGSVLADVNFEMTNVWGRTRDVYAIASRHSDMEEVCARAAQNLGLTLIPERDGEKGYVFRSDQFAFVRHGIPGVWLHEGVVSAGRPGVDVAALRQEYEKSHYNQVSDNVQEDWDLDGTVQMVEWAVEIVRVLGERDGLPGFHADSPFAWAR